MHCQVARVRGISMISHGETGTRRENSLSLRGGWQGGRGNPSICSKPLIDAEIGGYLTTKHTKKTSATRSRIPLNADRTNRRKDIRKLTFPATTSETRSRIPLNADETAKDIRKLRFPATSPNSDFRFSISDLYFSVSPWLCERLYIFPHFPGSEN